MTRILALETAGETCSVAIMDGDKVLEHISEFVEPDILLGGRT